MLQFSVSLLTLHVPTADRLLDYFSKLLFQTLSCFVRCPRIDDVLATASSQFFCFSNVFHQLFD